MSATILSFFHICFVVVCDILLKIFFMNSKQSLTFILKAAFLFLLPIIIMLVCLLSHPRPRLNFSLSSFVFFAFLSLSLLFYFKCDPKLKPFQSFLNSFTFFYCFFLFLFFLLHFTFQMIPAFCPPGKLFGWTSFSSEWKIIIEVIPVVWHAVCHFCVEVDAGRKV